MDKHITKIINEWNPIDIHPLLEDEYQPEVREIISVLSSEPNIDSFELANKINGIFLNYFGENLFQIKNQYTLEIAKKILEKKCLKKVIKKV